MWCQILTGCYPPAALFGFCVALISYMIVSVIKAALAGTYGDKFVDEQLPGYYLADGISATYRGMMNAIEAEEWLISRQLSQTQIMRLLRKLVKKYETLSVSQVSTWTKKASSKT